MTFSGRRGDPSVISDGLQVDLFARGADDTLLHWWEDQDGWTGAENLGGDLAGDPVAVRSGGRALDVFAHGKGGWLLHWSFDEHGTMVGPEKWREGRVVYDPVAVAHGDTIEVYARSATDDLLRWTFQGGAADGPRPFGGSTSSGLAALYRDQIPDVFGGGEDGLIHWGMRHWEGSAIDRPGWEDLGGSVAGTPAVASWGRLRIDVVARAPDGTLQHWGWAGDQRYYDDLGVWHTGRWYGDPDVNFPGRCDGDPSLVAIAKDRLELFGRLADGQLLQWSWDGTHGWSPFMEWSGPKTVGWVGSNPAALLHRGEVQVYAWHPDGRTLLRIVPSQFSITTSTWEVEFPTEPPPEPKVARVRTAVDHVLLRGEDLAVVGLGWSGYERRPEDPEALHRIAGADGRLAVTFPPQHIGEEVSPASGELVPPLDVGGLGAWRSVLAGPSQVVFAPTAERIALTAAGILTALQGAPVVAHDDSDAPQTELELPWQLIATLAGAAAANDHDSRPLKLDSGAVGLWRARVRAQAAGAQLALQALDAGGADPFPLALSHASRALILAQEAPARLDRLELSALGASLSAAGVWPSFEWEHDATLGRDRRVHVLVRGVLYPFGHRAQYAEITERADDGPIAALRKRTLLTVTEPVRGQVTDDPAMARVFPFETVEIVTREVTDLDDPSATGAWTWYTRPAHVPDRMQAELEDLILELRNPPEVPGDWVAGPPLMEDIVHALEDFFDGGGDPEDSGAEEAAEQASIGARMLEVAEEVQRLQEQIAAILEAREQPVPWFFRPERNGTPIEFAVRCDGVDLKLPLLFVTDVDLPATGTMTAFDSLQHPDIAGKLAAAFAGAGGVSLRGDPLDLVGSGQPGDVQIVNRLNIAGVAHGRGFRPRLGPPRPAGAAGLAPAEQWAFDVTLPAVRTLLPDRSAGHSVLARFSDAYESNGTVEDVAFELAGGILDINFSRHADRSGGLVSPVINADGLSRKAGPVNTEGLRRLDAERLFDEGATLLGFPLRTLLKDLDRAPRIVAELTDAQPMVSMKWEGVKLSEPFLAVTEGAQPMLTLVVESGTAGTKTECTLSDFALDFPTGTPLLRLSFRELVFRQKAGEAPALHVSGIDAKFLGELDLLQLLQDKVDLGDAGPTIDVSPSGVVARYALPVPDAAAGAFVVQNAVFSTAITVPFQGDPVSLTLGFAARDKPFNLTVMALGGGGYVDLELDHTGLQRLEISLQFGAVVEVEFVLAHGEAHVLGGIRYELQPDGSSILTGFIRIGGSLEVLGLVSVSVELLMSLGYQTTGNRLVGRATLVIEIDLTLYSDSVELDSGEWEIAGGDAPLAAPPSPVAAGTDPFLEEWREYRRAFGERA